MSRLAVVAVAGFALFCAPPLATGGAMARGDGASSPNPMRELTGSDGMDWRTFLAIQVAASEALRRNVKLENCRIRALDWSEARFVVLFTNPDPSDRWRGCPPGPCTCFDVELTKDELRVVKAHFSR
jgi:hypothetical protein